MDQPQRAVEDYDEAIDLDPQLALAYVNRAEVKTLLGRDTEAQQDVELAVGLGSDRSELEERIEKLKAR